METKKGFSALITIILAAIILAGGYFVLTKKLQAPFQAPTTTEQKSQDETANWKTYRNEQYGFEVKYPPIFSAVEQQIDNALDWYMERIVVFWSNKNTQKCGMECEQLFVDVYKKGHAIFKKTAFASLDDYISYKKQVFLTDPSYKESDVNFSKININGMEGVEQTSTIPGGDHLFIFFSNGLIYEIGGGNIDKNILNKTVNGLKFTKPTIVDTLAPAIQKSQNENTKLKTYTNQTWDIEFQYPADWTINESDESDNQVGHIISLTNPQYSSADIRIFFTSGLNRRGLQCPVGTHEIECKELQNSIGIKYTREINTGQLQYDHQQQLNAYSVFDDPRYSSPTDISITAIVTDINGVPLTSKGEIVKIFDQILSTLNFTK